jgi:hypothetical protein
MSVLRTVCVYCGSSSGNDPEFVAAARRLGRILAENGIGLVYGGGARGLMGALAQSVHEHGGTITGVIPDFLVRQELLFTHANEVVVTQDLHERKRVMFERADAFVALPGGIGTLEELVEQLTWAQLGHHKKPILLADVNGYWCPLIELIARMEGCGFIHSAALLRFVVRQRVEDILPALQGEIAGLSEDDRAGQSALIKRL